MQPSRVTALWAGVSLIRISIYLMVWSAQCFCFFFYQRRLFLDFSGNLSVFKLVARPWDHTGEEEGRSVVLWLSAVLAPGHLPRAAVSPREAPSPSSPSPRGSSWFSASLSVLPSVAPAGRGPGEGGSHWLGRRSSAATVRS